MIHVHLKMVIMVPLLKVMGVAFISGFCPSGQITRVLCTISQVYALRYRSVGSTRSMDSGT